MATLVRASSAFCATRDPSLPSLRGPSSSQTLIRCRLLSTQLLFPSAEAQFRSSNNVVSNSSGFSPSRPRAMAASVHEALPPPLTSTSAPPNLFDGTTRLGLQDRIQLCPIDLNDRPAWYKEKVHPTNKVPALEHNNEVRGESLDLIKYIDSNFEGPSLLPDDSAKREFAEDLLSYTGTFYDTIVSSFKDVNLTEAGAAFDYIETALSKFDGPFFLGQFSLVDIAYAPFVERFQPFLMDVRNHDITAGRPRLAAWIEEMNKIDAYKQTCRDPKELVERYKKRFLASL